MRPMTPVEYAEGKGLKCPYCRSDELEGASWNADEDYATQEMACLACNMCWEDFYKLVGYVE